MIQNDGGDWVDQNEMIMKEENEEESKKDEKDEKLEIHPHKDVLK